MKTMTRIGLRTYLEITAISKPPEAEEGDWVYVGVQVTNKHTADIYAVVTAGVDGITTYPVGGAPATLAAGDYKWWPIHFTMPNKSVQGIVAAFYWSADGWIKDDEQTFSVALVGVPPPEWEFLDSKPFTISPGVVPAEWEFLDSEPFTIEPGVVPAEWEFLDSEPFTIEPGVAPPPPPPPPIAGIPTWMIAAGAIGVVAAIGALVYLSSPAPTKKKPEKKKE